MATLRKFFKRKDIVPSLQRYGIDALGAMAQGLFCTLLVGTILNTLGQQFGIAFLNEEDIPYRKVYLLRDGGALEELSL